MLKRITAKDFYSIYANKNSEFDSHEISHLNEFVVKFENYEIDEEIFISSGLIKSVLFKNCTIKYISLRDISGTPKSVYIDNSRVSEISLTNARLRSLIVSDASEVSRLEVHSSTVVDQIYVHSNTILRQFKFANSSTTNLYFSNSKNIGHISLLSAGKCKNIVFDSCTCIWMIMQEASEVGKLLLSNLSSIGNISVETNCKFELISLQNSSINSELTFLESNSEKITLFDSWVGKIQIFKSSRIDMLLIESSKIFSIEFSSSTAKTIEILRGSYVKNIELLYLLPESKRMIVDHSCIESLVPILEKAYNLSFTNSEIWQFQLKNNIIPKDSTLLLSDTKINELLIHSALNQGTVIFNNLTPLTCGLVLPKTKQNASELEEKRKVRRFSY